MFAHFSTLPRQRASSVRSGFPRKLTVHVVHVDAERHIVGRRPPPLGV